MTSMFVFTGDAFLANCFAQRSHQYIYVVVVLYFVRHK